MSQVQTSAEEPPSGFEATPAGLGPEESPGPAQAAAEQRAPPPTMPLRGRRAPWIAAILAGVPGLGSVYNGSYARGVAFFLTILGLMHLASRSGEIWGFGVAFVWLFNIIDAYREARLIQAGVAHDLGALRRPTATSAAEGVGLGIVLLLLGLVAFLDSTLGLDVDWVFELWPVGMMAAGAWFLWTALRRSRSAREAPGDRSNRDRTAAPSSDFTDGSPVPDAADERGEPGGAGPVAPERGPERW